MPGTGTATFDVPAISGINWQLWFVPEPGGLAIIILGGVVLFRRS
jgi:hypothetical protein